MDVRASNNSDVFRNIDKMPVPVDAMDLEQQINATRLRPDNGGDFERDFMDVGQSAKVVESSPLKQGGNTAPFAPDMGTAASVPYHDPEFTEFKANHRGLLEQKAKIVKRLEAMRREYDFIDNLDP
jgi:hypothetical protein